MPKRFYMDPDRDPWDQQPGETDVAYQAFDLYLHQLDNGGPRRSQRGAAKMLDKSRQLIGHWSAENNWQQRCEAYDRDQAALKRSESNRRVVKAAERHGKDMERMAQALLEPVNAYLERLRLTRADGDDPFEGVPLTELSKDALTAIRLMPALVQAERLVLGLTTSKTELSSIDADRAEAQRAVHGKSQSDLEAYLTGVDDGRQAEQAKVLGLDETEVE